MSLSRKSIKIVEPKNQLNLYGYENYFSSFKKLYEKNILPNVILISGQKGIGKSTFFYHFINFLLSKKEDHSYSITSYSINENNSSYQLLNKNIHPNFFSLEINKSENEIKIDKVRNLLNFLSKTTYSKDLKIVMIDNVENLNLNSANALLKSMEEPNRNTFFFLTHSIENKILDTIKSRCTSFKIFFTKDEKKNIFQNIINKYENLLETKFNLNDLYFFTPGNFVKYLSILDQNEFSDDDKFSNVINLINKYRKDKDSEILYFISLLIEKFYRNLFLTNPKKIHKLLFNFNTISRQINDMKRFNLDDKAIFIWLEDTLKNEER